MTGDITRLLEKRVLAYLRPQKAALLFGARRVGKTVLLKKIVENFAGKTLLLNGEDYDAQALLAERSVANYRRLLTGIDLLAIDEAQNIPEIGQKIKLVVDEIAATRVLASGSSSFDLLNKTGEPLVGRSAAFLLTPFSQAELAPQEDALTARQNLETRLIYGAYPEVTRLENPEEKTAYLRDLVNAYLLKDILAVEGIKNSGKMRDLLRLVAWQLGGEITYENLGGTLGLSKNTVEKYLDLLNKVFIGYRLGAYARNLRKEVRKTGKWYFYDNGIRNALIGNFQPLALRDDVGALWENYLIGERLKDRHNRGVHKEFYFWRTYDGQEIDLIEQHGEQLTACEFKWGARKTKLPPAFAEAYPQAAYRVVHRDNYADFIMPAE
ncbi:MAG: ATP-binding protein [Planctomycetota bacterium]|jgi:predicted AAA+ superfamily ATPase|nr:ATP-binding protein [Planctomycetota bacterium]